MSLHPITVSPAKVNGLIVWTLTYGKRSGSKEGEYPPVELREGGTNERFKITLVDPTLGITFSDDPLWIQAGSCPTTPGLDPSQIDKFEPGPTIVRFRDLNQNAPVSLWYRLNFNVPGLNPGDPGTFLDPEIKNGGNGGPGVGQWAALAGLAVAAAIAFAAYKVFFDH